MKPKLLWSLAALGFVIFILTQVLPSVVQDPASSESSKAISKEQAIKAASSFAEETLKINTSNVENPLVTYSTDSDLYGYLSKEKLLQDYTKKYDQKFPTERFRVKFEQPEPQLSALVIDVGMSTGNVVGFEMIDSWSSEDKKLILDTDQNGLSKLQALEGSITLEDKAAGAEPYLKALGYDPKGLTVQQNQTLGLTYQVNGYKIGNSHAELVFGYEYGQVTSMQSKFTVPAVHTDYVKSQTKLATWLTFGGYGLLSFILGILAIVYSARTRPHASFGRGVFLTLFYLFINVVSTLNMLPVFKSQGLDGIALDLALIMQGLITVAMTASIYFSLVGGDGLWRQKGQNLWMRTREPGYGRHVLQSAINGYAWAFILLGLQSVIFIVLGLTLNMWTTTDESQSPYNMVYPWVFPIMAWMAGIGEEAVYRLFGIPMLKKIVRSTFIASLITTLIWAFGHTLYPIYPVISRPIELTFIGLMFSYIFLRSGYIGAMFAHVVFDSILMGLSLVLMGGTTNILTGVITFAAPAIVGYIVYLFNPPSKERTKKEPLITTPHPEGQL
ncbi:CPBP family intramembrane glutamic endopeptidase [Paenibacillus sp. CAA11]|uniref:CPBP family intramembrane glutamic endopeptidase n=1 Tax=Paenibacillus sp. CAA11 TaxID=1532905 RepID=UPI001F23D208|nr:type II CAAX endopeptidase family protein [Paenibacillus sp. CAA11]